MYYIYTYRQLTSSYVHVPYPTSIFVSTSINDNEREPLKYKMQYCLIIKLRNKLIVSFLPELVQRYFVLFLFQTNLPIGSITCFSILRC